MTDRDLLRLHIEAVWEISIPPLDDASLDLPPSDSLPPWPMYQARLSHEQVTLWRPDASPAQRADILQRARNAGVAFDPALGMRREVVLRLLDVPPANARPRHGARLLTADDAALLETFEVGSVSYYLSPQRAPCFGVIVDGKLVSVAHSSRRTSEACELGIDTRTEARRQGYATAATVAWTDAVRQEGLVPIYSAFAYNTPSLRLAAAAGYTPAIESVYGPVRQADE